MQYEYSPSSCHLCFDTIADLQNGSSSGLRGVIEMHKSFYCPKAPIRLCFIWALGLLIGIVTAYSIDNVAFLMRLAACSQVSIVLVLLGGVLPLLIAAYAVTIHEFYILALLCFLRCMGYGFMLCLCLRAFEDAAWLLQPMLQFSDSAFLVMLAYIAFRGSKYSRRDIYLCGVIAIIVSAADHFVVSPFLMTLLTF